jgi:plasmid stability protein
MHDRRRLFFVAVVCVAATSVLPLSGQEPTEEPRSIEELYLESDVGIAVIRSQILSEDRGIQLLGLNVLQAQVERGSIDPDGEAYVELLETALAGGVMNLSNNRSLLPDGYDPEIRIVAARLLAESGRDEAVEILYDVLRFDPEPSVKAQAMYSLGAIGKDPDQTVSYLIARLISRESTRQADEAMVYAGLQSIQALVRVVGREALHPDVHDAVVGVAAGNYNRVVRTKAIELLSEL